MQKLWFLLQYPPFCSSFEPPHIPLVASLCRRSLRVWGTTKVTFSTNLTQRWKCNAVHEAQLLTSGLCEDAAHYCWGSELPPQHRAVEGTTDFLNKEAASACSSLDPYPGSALLMFTTWLYFQQHLELIFQVWILCICARRLFSVQVFKNRTRILDNGHEQFLYKSSTLPNYSVFWKSDVTRVPTMLVFDEGWKIPQISSNTLGLFFFFFWA